MTPERWQQIKALVEEALEREPDQRTVFLKEACAGDESLRREAEVLILADREMSSFMERPAHRLLGDSAKTLIIDEDPRRSRNVLKIGETFLSKYSILRLIGKGGMGQVYQARHESLGTTVAIKVLNGYLATDDEAIERFEREARTAAKLDHPNTVRVFDYGAKDMVCYLVMEYLEGESLRDRLSRVKRIPLPEAVAFAEQVCGVLEAVHEKEIVHRDLKPDNIFFHKTGDEEIVKLLDFGIAKLNTYTRSAKILTQSGAVFGTPHYMSPEQCQGKTLDARSDIYSFGVILYEMLAGCRPFEADSPLSFMYAHVNTPPPDPRQFAPDIPPEASKAILRALAKKPDARHQSAKELFQALREAASSKSGFATETILSSSSLSTETSAASSTGPSKRLLAAIAVMLAAVVAASAWLYGNQSPVPMPVKKVETVPLPPADPLLDKLGGGFVFIEGIDATIGRNAEDCKAISDCEISEDESPSHIVKLAPYYLSKYEVTNREYAEFVSATKRKPPAHWRSGIYAKGEDDLPVVNVSWKDAAEYCEWRSRRDSVQFRLPTEAQWEHAARGGDARLFPWGNIWEDDFANANRKDGKTRRPLPVDSAPNNTKDRSPFGIFAMAGNVREWTDSKFQPYPGSGYQPKGSDLKCRVVRGGSFDIKPTGLRTTFRTWELETTADKDLGFRLAASPLSIDKK